MRNTLFLLAAQARTPMIKFLGKRSSPKSVDHAPQPHPASPSHELPDSFASYRGRAQQHGPMGRQSSGTSSISSSSDSSGRSTSSTASAQPPIASIEPYGAIGGTAGSKLGSIRPKNGEFFDRSELPRRFARLEWTEEEIEAVSSGGASAWA